MASDSSLWLIGPIHWTVSRRVVAQRHLSSRTVLDPSVTIPRNLLAAMVARQPAVIGSEPSRSCEPGVTRVQRPDAGRGSGPGKARAGGAPPQAPTGGGGSLIAG